MPASPLAARLETASVIIGSCTTIIKLFASRATNCWMTEPARGTEGRVWYMRTLPGDVVMFKCKPESVEQIHFAAGAGLSKNIVRATAYNVLETDSEVG